MSRSCFCFVIAVCAVVGGFGGAARADIAPDVRGAGPSLAPPGDNPAARNIAMAKEHVTLELHTVNGGKDGGFVVVDASFTLRAPRGPEPGAAVSLNVTFPGEGVRVGDAYENHPKLYGFKAFIDGKPVATRAEVKEHTTEAGPPSSPYKRTRRETWHTFPAVIDDETVVRVRYAVAADPMSGEERQTHAKAQYILHTGALWAGKIGEAVVEVKGAGVDVAQTSLRTLAMPPVSLVSLRGDGPPPPVSPPGTVRSKAAITTTFRDLEPTAKDDVEVVFPCPRAAYGDNPMALWAAMEDAAR